MELIFLYIERFRNLTDLELNFSPAYHANYDRLTNELDVKKRRTPLKNFFGPDFQNITGIIGKNGSGKSNILELICLLTKDTIPKNFRNFIIVFRQRKNESEYLQIKTNISGLAEPPYPAEIQDSKKTIPNLSVIYFSNVSDGRDLVFSNDVIDLSENKNKYTSKRETETYNQIKFLLSEYRQEVKISSPETIIISPRHGRKYNFSQLKELKTNSPIYEQLYQSYRHVNRTFPAPLTFRLLFRFSILTHVVQKLAIKSNLGRQLNEMLEDAFSDNANKGSIVKKLQDIVELHETIGILLTRAFNNFENILEINQTNALSLIDFDHQITALAPIYSEPGFQNNISFIFPFDQQAQAVFKQNLAVFDYPEIIDVAWTGLSSGHKAFLNIFSQFHSAIRRVSQHDNVLICIDEGDLYLHPQWQQAFLSQLIDYIPLIIRKKIQLIFTTHSPFLVSDLPRENLILLRQNSEGSVEVIDHEESMQVTFGANIVDLFMGPFFLETGTISQFALKKIRWAIKVALNKETATQHEIREANIIANLTGDEMIRYKLQKMLNNDPAN